MCISNGESIEKEAEYWKLGLSQLPVISVYKYAGTEEREGGKERGRKGVREGARKGGRKGGRKEVREGGRERGWDGQMDGQRGSQYEQLEWGCSLGSLHVQLLQNGEPGIQGELLGRVGI